MLEGVIKWLFILVVVAYWRKVKGILDSLTDLTKAALKDGCLKDFFSWIGWSLIVALLDKVRNNSSNVSLTLFFYFVFFLWSVSLLGIMDSISDFFIKYLKLKVSSINGNKLIILMLIQVVMMTVIFLITMESAKEIIAYLFKVNSS